MLPEIEIYRIEDKDGVGPFCKSYLPTNLLEELHDALESPLVDFGIIFDDEYGSSNIYEKFCQSKLKAKPEDCIFGFTESSFKQLVGNRFEEIKDYVSVYKSNNYIISKSERQVLFTKT